MMMTIIVNHPKNEVNYPLLDTIGFTITEVVNIYIYISYICIYIIYMYISYMYIYKYKYKYKYPMNHPMNNHNFPMVFLTSSVVNPFPGHHGHGHAAAPRRRAPPWGCSGPRSAARSPWRWSLISPHEHMIVDILNMVSIDIYIYIWSHICWYRLI